MSDNRICKIVRAVCAGARMTCDKLSDDSDDE